MMFFSEAALCPASSSAPFRRGTWCRAELNGARGLIMEDSNPLTTISLVSPCCMQWYLPIGRCSGGTAGDDSEALGVSACMSAEEDVLSAAFCKLYLTRGGGRGICNLPWAGRASRHGRQRSQCIDNGTILLAIHGLNPSQSSLHGSVCHGVAYGSRGSSEARKAVEDR